MTATLTAVYRGGVFHPATPPDLADGTTVQLTLVATPTPPPAGGMPPGRAAYEMIRAIAALPTEGPPAADGLVVSENVDAILYADPRGVR